MERLRKRKWISLTLLSIVVPVTLLATFRLTGILQGPLKISETEILEPVKWEFERPNQTVPIVDRLEASYSSDGLSAILGLTIAIYIENTTIILHDDILMALVINSTTTSKNGFIDDVYVAFSGDSQKSKVELLETDFDFKNFSLIEKVEGMTRRDELKAFIRLAGVNHTSNAYGRVIAVWELMSPNNQTHELEIIYEIIYYNGTAYKKIVQPFQLKILWG